MKECIKCKTPHGQVDELVQWSCKSCGTINFNSLIKMVVKEEEVINEDEPISEYDSYKDGE